jgi:hypothetical protein
VGLSLQLTAFLVSKRFCKKVEIAIYMLGSSLLNNQYSLSELFKYGKLLHNICISFTKRHLSLMYKGRSNRKCNSSSTLSRLQNKHFLCSLFIFIYIPTFIPTFFISVILYSQGINTKSKFSKNASMFEAKAI